MIVAGLYHLGRSKMQLELGEKFYRGAVVPTGSEAPRIVVGKANKALAHRIATGEAKKMEGTWLVEHCEVVSGQDGLEVKVLGRWTEADGALEDSL